MCWTTILRLESVSVIWVFQDLQPLRFWPVSVFPMQIFGQPSSEMRHNQQGCEPLENKNHTTWIKDLGKGYFLPPQSLSQAGQGWCAGCKLGFQSHKEWSTWDIATCFLYLTFWINSLCVWLLFLQLCHEVRQDHCEAGLGMGLQKCKIVDGRWDFFAKYLDTKLC